ncbi:MAG: tRNA uridine(34) 5-carboxymethylaminomethyl modification radical SAM/GNAT enzyme Elp3 [Eggerthellaceae bacterium]|nr:tRNA uridine(34) 5-carboxymethylaminomethyl modification radical SAM/GNAT enzyme Elp3 [Eggerthellaceae bacterium]
MDEAVRDILDALRERELSPSELDRIIRKHSKRAHDGRRIFAKKRILPYYLKVKEEGGSVWQSWNVGDELDGRFIRAMQMKPRRTASGVATITVITKPWPCANSCVYCPNDERMPKSYLSDEPACQRAERNFFHPYLQVASRLRTLQQMGHDTGKVELIVLGGTWLDYPREYRRWFISELFCALNDDDKAREHALSNTDDLAHDEACISGADLAKLQTRNEAAQHRVVGLVVETRPDTVTPGALAELRQLGCTKLQLGIQSIDDDILHMNGRKETVETIRRSLELARLFGFKTHTHFMVNLLGATPESDKRDYRVFANDPAYSPDEVKLYPCALVGGTELVERYEDGSWKPYSEEELIDVLCDCMLHTRPFTRVSRMIRDISAKDILVGNKKTNLRQLVDEELQNRSDDVREIRFREIATEEVVLDDLRLDEVAYGTTATDEVFLQWVTPSGMIAGFLRLSMPHEAALERYESLPIGAGEAMIREVHVYGFATAVDSKGSSAQHHGLGKQLVERACRIAKEAGYDRVNVISAVGTREYYRKLGFSDNGLYQQRVLE